MIKNGVYAVCVGVTARKPMIDHSRLKTEKRKSRVFRKNNKNRTFSKRILIFEVILDFL